MYDDIKVQDLLSFIDISVDDIEKINENDYSQFYDEHFKNELLMMKSETFYNIRQIKPAVIFEFLNKVDVNGSDILNYLCRKYQLKEIYLCDHPSFEAVKTSIFAKGYLEEKELSKNKLPRNINVNSLFDLSKIQLQKPEIVESYDNDTTLDLDDDKVWSILDEIKEKFIGQENACEDLFYNIVNNQQLASMDDISDGQRSIIFLDGPTGTGKTAITREITDKLKIPFTSSSATSYSATGYVGGNITDTLKELYKKADGDLEKAERGIIVFDEFDKIAYSRGNGGIEMKKAVQQQLLDFMGGGKYNISVGNNLFFNSSVEFDTSKLTFICLGALSDLRETKTNQNQALGFGTLAETTDIVDYTITPQDLMNIGLERELVGRFNTYLHTDEYSKEDLLRILKESTISPILGFEKWIESRGKKLQIDDGVYGAIVDAAYELNTGARSLQTVMNNIRTRFIKDVLRGKDGTIYLDESTVNAVITNAMTRKSRR